MMASDPFEELLNPQTQESLKQFFSGDVIRFETSVVRDKRDRQFLPAIPERLFCLLAPLPARSLAVFLVILLRTRLERTISIALTTAAIRRYGLTQNDKRRALQCLEAAGLITVDSRPRKNPIVTLTSKALGLLSKPGRNRPEMA